MKYQLRNSGLIILLVIGSLNLVACLNNNYAPVVDGANTYHPVKKQSMAQRPQSMGIGTGIPSTGSIAATGATMTGTTSTSNEANGQGWVETSSPSASKTENAQNTNQLSALNSEVAQIKPSENSNSTAKNNQQNNSAASTTSAVNSGMASDNKLAWPARGKVINPFDGKKGGNQGIDIAGKKGQAVLAASDGQVVYSGSGLAGYGKLLIIKHKNNLLTAYGHNEKILVAEGEQVHAGQKIAEMGAGGDGQAKLHFEVRKGGTPVNPSQYLN